jgi:hypothetical protein
MLFEFQEQRPPEAHVVRIAVAEFAEEQAYLPWVDPDSAKSKGKPSNWAAPFWSPSRANRSVL